MIECSECGELIEEDEAEYIDGQPYCSNCAEEIESDRASEEDWL